MVEKMKKASYSVPDGYFDRLEERLSRIPEMSSDVRRGPLYAIRPYVSLAASFLIILAAGTMVLKFSARDGSDLVPVTDPDLIYLADDEEVEYDALEQYLIESGTTLEQLEYYYEGND